MKQDPITTAIETLTAQREAHLASAAKILRALDVLEEYRPAAEQAEPPAPRKPAKATPPVTRPSRPPKVEKPASGQKAAPQVAKRVYACGACGKKGHTRKSCPKAAAKPVADSEDAPVAPPADEVAAKRAARAEAIAAKLRAGERKAAAPRPPVVKDPNRDPRVFRCQGRIPVESTGSRAQGTTTCGALVFGNKRGEHARTVHGVAGVEYVLVESEEAAS